MTNRILSAGIALLLGALPAAAQKNSASLLTGAGVWQMQEPDGWEAVTRNRVVWISSAYYRRQPGTRWAVEGGVSRSSWKDTIRQDDYDYGATYLQQTRHTGISLGGAYKVLKSRKNNSGGLWAGAGLSRIQTRMISNGTYYSGWSGPGLLENEKEVARTWMAFLQLSYEKQVYKKLFVQGKLAYSHIISLSSYPYSRPFEPQKGMSLQCGLGYAF
jgi:hypothetical protein